MKNTFTVLDVLFPLLTGVLGHPRCLGVDRTVALRPSKTEAMRVFSEDDGQTHPVETRVGGLGGVNCC